MKKGLILEGGAMRGMFTCGVLDVFMENGIVFDGAAGISAGAVFGCNLKSEQIGRAIRYNKNYCRDPRYCSIASLLKTGDLYGADFCYRELPEILDPFDRDTFRKNRMDFYVGATETQSGEIVYHNCLYGDKEDMDWMRASASMPLVSRPVTINTDSYLDGGISDPVPYRCMEEAGYDRNIIVLTQPEGYVKKKSSALPLMKLFLGRYPGIINAMSKRHDVYNRQMKEIKEKEERHESLVIRPKESLNIGRTEKDPEELERVYQLGRKAALERLDEIKDFLSEKN
ncbi:MAG: patatin family protein [Erysipelotrichaceae bacterium]|nr:patatin family protein [Erysipelotrichaceae bacterium]